MWKRDSAMSRLVAWNILQRRFNSNMHVYCYLKKYRCDFAVIKMGISRSRVGGKINLARPQAGVNLKGSVISNADPSGRILPLKPVSLLQFAPSFPVHILCMCLHDVAYRKDDERFDWSFSRWMCEISDSRSQRFQEHYEPNGPDFPLENIRTRCIGAHRIHSCLSVIFCHSFHYQFLFRPQVWFSFPPRVCDNDCRSCSFY